MFVNNTIVRAISESDNVDNCGSKSSQFVKRVNSLKLKLILVYFLFIFCITTSITNQGKKKKKEFN